MTLKSHKCIGLQLIGIIDSDAAFQHAGIPPPQLAAFGLAFTFADALGGAKVLLC